MAGFRFRLQTFLKLKRQLEKKAKNEFGQAVIKLQEEQDRLNDIIEHIDVCCGYYRNACTGILSPEKIKKLRYYLDHIQKQKERQEVNVKRQKENVDNLRVKLVEAMKERKVIEKLREKAFQEYLRQEGIREQKLIDDLVSFKEAKKL
jgi:flagellar FliJ protein